MLERPYQEVGEIELRYTGDFMSANSLGVLNLEVQKALNRVISRSLVEMQLLHPEEEVAYKLNKMKNWEIATLRIERIHQESPLYELLIIVMNPVVQHLLGQSFDWFMQNVAGDLANNILAELMFIGGVAVYKALQRDASQDPSGRLRDATMNITATATGKRKDGAGVPPRGTHAPNLEAQISVKEPLSHLRERAKKYGERLETRPWREEVLRLIREGFSVGQPFSLGEFVARHEWTLQQQHPRSKAVRATIRRIFNDLRKADYLQSKGSGEYVYTGR